MDVTMARKSASDAGLYDHFLWDIANPTVTEDRLQSIAAAVCHQYKTTRETKCVPDFYPYSDLKSTIRIENGITRIRISDILRTAPEDILESLVHILIARALRRKPQSHWLDRFNKYIHQPDVEASHARTRRARHRKILSCPQGKFHDLAASFQRVNRQYFQDSLPQPNLSWSPSRCRRQLGYHDSALNLIVISRYLDRRDVPELVVDYIMYHELLHTLIRPKIHRGKRIVHPPEFKHREREFEQFSEALRWLGEVRKR